MPSVLDPELTVARLRELGHTDAALEVAALALRGSTAAPTEPAAPAADPIPDDAAFIPFDRARLFSISDWDDLKAKNPGLYDRTLESGFGTKAVA
jgi:hypothetical protein